MKTYEQRTQDIMQKAQTENLKKQKRAKLIAKWSVAASILLAFNLILFVPYQTGGIDVKKYADSEYYPVIQKLSTITYGKPYTTNNFKQFFSCSSAPKYEIAAPDGWYATEDSFDAPKGDSGMSVSDNNSGTNAPTSNAPTSNGNYNEVTNNQTKGVTEGDLFKRSDKYIYYLNYTPNSYDGTKYVGDEFILKTYSVAGAQSELVCEYKISPQEDFRFVNYAGASEIFLSKDCNTVTVIVPCYNRSANNYFTQIFSLDVSDAANVKETNRISVSGLYISSRTVDGTMYFVSNFAVNRPDFDNEQTFLPQIGAPDDMHTLPLENIVCPEEATSANYTVICSLDEKSLKIKDKTAILSFSNNLYVSENNIFVTRDYSVTTETKNQYNLTYTNRVTEIYRVEYSEGALTEKGSVKLDGTIPDRYCMDEYKGVLRVFTNCSYSGSYAYLDGNNPYDYMDGKNLCNLYCVDLNNYSILAEKKAFAPTGESVRSARFYGDTAYVCTAVEIINITDPVFAFDLSDYNNITYKDTGTIPGFSLSLTAFTDDTLIGIGYGDTRSDLKVEIYRRTDSNVQCVTEYISKNTAFSGNFKAYFIDAEKGLVGLATRPNWDELEYTVLKFDEYGLHKLLSLSIDPEDHVYYTYGCDVARATYIDGYMYIFARNTFKVINL